MEHKQLTWPQRGALWLRLGIRLGLTALAVWLAARFGRPLLSLFAPFLLALIAAAALNPLVKKLQRLLGWNRQVLTLLLLFLIFGLLGGGLALLVYAAAGQLVSLVQNWGGLLDSLQAVMDQLEALFARLLTLVPPPSQRNCGKRRGQPVSVAQRGGPRRPGKPGAGGRRAGHGPARLSGGSGHLYYGHLPPYGGLPLSPQPVCPAPG